MTFLWEYRDVIFRTLLVAGSMVAWPAAGAVAFRLWNARSR